MCLFKNGAKDVFEKVIISIQEKDLNNENQIYDALTDFFKLYSLQVQDLYNILCSVVKPNTLIFKLISHIEQIYNEGLKLYQINFDLSNKCPLILDILIHRAKLGHYKDKYLLEPKINSLIVYQIISQFKKTKAINIGHYLDIIMTHKFQNDFIRLVLSDMSMETKDICNLFILVQHLLPNNQANKLSEICSNLQNIFDSQNQNDILHFSDYIIKYNFRFSDSMVESLFTIYSDRMRDNANILNHERAITTLLNSSCAKKSLVTKCVNQYLICMNCVWPKIELNAWQSFLKILYHLDLFLEKGTTKESINDNIWWADVFNNIILILENINYSEWKAYLNNNDTNKTFTLAISTLYITTKILKKSIHIKPKKKIFQLIHTLFPHLCEKLCEKPKLTLYVNSDKIDNINQNDVNDKMLRNNHVDTIWETLDCVNAFILELGTSERLHFFEDALRLCYIGVPSNISILVEMLIKEQCFDIKQNLELSQMIGKLKQKFYELVTAKPKNFDTMAQWFNAFIQLSLSYITVVDLKNPNFYNSNHIGTLNNLLQQLYDTDEIDSIYSPQIWIFLKHVLTHFESLFLLNKNDTTFKLNTIEADLLNVCLRILCSYDCLGFCQNLMSCDIKSSDHYQYNLLQSILKDSGNTHEFLSNICQYLEKYLSLKLVDQVNAPKTETEKQQDILNTLNMLINDITHNKHNHNPEIYDCD